MLTALYRSHHELPFWDGDTNPFDVFQPEKHKLLPWKGKEIIDGNSIIGNETITLEQERYLFSLLSGLHNVQTNEMMAHVSGLCKCQFAEHGWWHYEKRVWVQITTKPNEFTPDGIPIVYDMVGKRKMEIKSIWGGDNGTYSPYSFFLKDDLREKAANDPKIWERFFVEQLNLDPKLKTAKNDFCAARDLLKEAERDVKSLQIFGPNELNLKLNVSFDVC